MTAQIIDVKIIAENVRKSVAEEVAKMIAAGKPRPGLATVLVGDRVDSATYVRSKQKACGEAGIESFGFTLPATATEQPLGGAATSVPPAASPTTAQEAAEKPAATAASSP